MSIYLQGATIHGGEFRSIKQTIQNCYHRVGIQALNQAISHGAMHNSTERDPPPRCHPGTREKATEDIVRWIEEPNPSSTVLWVNGRAGVGKSALMQRIAELGLTYFGGCFFFRRGAPGCNVKDRLFSTLAYQLAMNVDGMVELVDRAMIQDFSLSTMSAADQLKRLIIAPIRLLPIPRPIIIIIIDGLDECEVFDSQRDILTLIGQVTMDPDVTIRFVIASRPEHQICEMFNKEPLFSRTRRLVLDEGYYTSADIERYLREKFEEIHSRNRDIMPDVRSPWPSKYDLRELVCRASGQFIYAATIVKFVGSNMDFHTPEERLNFILKPGPMQASAFSESDRLYTQILSLYPDSQVLVHTLGIVLALERFDTTDFKMTLTTIAMITGFGEVNVLLVFRALQSITEVWTEPVFDDAGDNEPNGTNIRHVKLSHRSFHDFLTDKARSGPYFSDEELFGGRVLCRILELATISIKELRRCSSLPTTNPGIWRQFETIFEGAGDGLKTSSKMELYLALNNLRATLFHEKLPLCDEHLSKPFWAALVPILHCICICARHSIRLFDLPPEDPLQLDQFSTKTRDLLDECYRQTLSINSSSAVGPLNSLLIRLALEMSGPTRAKSLREMGNISNISDRQLLKRFIEEHSLPAIYKPEDRRFKYVLAYYVPDELRDFIFDPIRSRCFYPTSWIIDKCQWAMKELQSNPQFHSSFLLDFFQPCAVVGVSDANRLLEHVRNGSDNNDLLLFLKYLSEIHWLDFYTRGWYGRQVANGIVRWVCTALESSSLEPGNIRDAMHKVFTGILPCGILPALSQHISRASELGIFENQSCLRCLRYDVFESLLDLDDFEMLSQILPMFTGLSTILVESVLLGRVREPFWRDDFPHTCRNDSTHSEGNFKEAPIEISQSNDSNQLHFLLYPANRRRWRFAVAHASTSSKCIFFAIQCFSQLGPSFRPFWIVSEMIDWLKNQTVDPQPQDQLIAWMEDAHKKVEKVIATHRQRDIDEDLRRYAEWASVIQRS